MVDPGLLDHVLVTTSMGPPLKAAENSQPQHRIRPRNRYFNGAAAKSSGKLTVNCHCPPPKLVDFNGAAAKSSGKYPPAKIEALTRPLDFNGAAAKSSGKSARRHDGGGSQETSMGPPLKAAKNRPGLPRCRRRHRHHFNGAAAKSSGK